MKKLSLLLIMSLVLFASCKKSIESEKRAWDVNLREANEQKYEYPSFANVINEQIKTAETAMNETQTIADEKLKIQKMAEANSLLNITFMRNLKEIKTLKFGIRTKSSEARGLKFDYTEMMSSNQVIADGERTIYDSDTKLKSIVSSRADADALSNLVLSDLRTAVSNLDRIISKVKERENLEKKKTEQLIAEKAAVEKQKTEAAQPVKCSYCGVLNAPDAINCTGCGAPLKK